MMNQIRDLRYKRKVVCVRNERNFRRNRLSDRENYFRGGLVILIYISNAKPLEYL